MVAKKRGSAGKLRFLTIVKLVLVAGLAYYGWGWITIYYKYWSVKQEMNSTANLAQGLSDNTIHGRIVAKIESLGLPPAAVNNIRIQRNRRPLEILIWTSYDVRIRVPFRAPIVRTLKPEARQALGSF